MAKIFWFFVFQYVQLKGDFSLFEREHEFVFGALHSEQSLKTTAYSTLTAFPTPDNYNEWDGSFPYTEFSEMGNVSVDIDTEQTGFYGATRFNISDALKVIVGGRLSRWKQEGLDYSGQLDFGDSGVFVPYAGILYDLTDNHRVYASYTEIFQPQNNQDVNGDYLDPLVGSNMEIGLKSRFLDEAVQTSIALFRIEQDNLAQAVDGAVVPGGAEGDLPRQAYAAAQGTVSQGFEIEVVGEPIEGWNISVGYAQFKAEDAADNAVNTDHPRKLFNLFSTYRFGGSMDGLTLGGGVNWRSKNYSDTANPITGEPFRFQQDAFALVSLMARYDFTAQLSLQANVENLTDKTYYSQIGFFQQYRYGKPRSFSLGLTYQF